MNRRELMIAAAAGLVASLTHADTAKTHTVRALTRDPDDPDQSMLPDGAEPWSGPFGRDFTVTLETPGYYG